MNMITKRDAAIIALIFLAGVLLFALPQLIGKGTTAKIIVDGKTVREVSLSRNTTFTENGIEFEVRDGKIAVISSPCRDKICEHMGFIGSPSQTIVCLPEKTAVVISGKSGADLTIG